MDQTPTRSSRFRDTDVNVLDDNMTPSMADQKHGRIKKPPPITPRRFNKFFAPRPRNTAGAVKTSRAALRTISSSNLNSRRRILQIQDAPEDYLPANENETSRKKRKHSQISSLHSTPLSRTVNFLPSSQDALPSSPIRYGRDQDDNAEHVIEDDDDEYASTEIDEDAWSADEHELPTGPRITPFSRTSTSRNILASRLTGRGRIGIADTSNLWQYEAANFYSKPGDVNIDLRSRQPPIIPFSMAACHTNPVIASGDEEGFIRFLDSANANNGEEGFGKTVLAIQPHDNALMDMTFSDDDVYIATASGDQTCSVIDVQAHRSLYSLRAHTASVKKIQFQPGSGNKVLASCGRDGTICLWDTRLKGQPAGSGKRERRHITGMAEDVSFLAPVLEIFGAHDVGTKHKSATKAKQGTVAGRNEFSITSLTFLDAGRNNMLATASEVDTVVKLWDLRTSQISARKKGHSQHPVSITAEPKSHALHRAFGINSLALTTDGSKLFALARDHTVYAYSTSHLILGCTPEMVHYTTVPRNTMAPTRISSNPGLGPVYALRHPSLRVATFWPRLSIRKATNSNSELLAVASTDDSVILFPTSERYQTASTRSIPSLHDPHQTDQYDSAPTSMTTRSNAVRPRLQRATTTSFNTLFTKSRAQEDNLPIYYHGTPLIHGHSKEVTSVAWSSEGNLITASDDFTVRCWREDAGEARQLRRLHVEKSAAEVLGCGWAGVGVEGWDEEY